MGWLRLVGSFKLYVSFAEYGLFYRSLLQKGLIFFLWQCTAQKTDRKEPYCLRRAGARYSMGWLRLVDSFKLYVSFAEYGLFYRSLLQRRAGARYSMGWLRLVGSFRVHVSFAEYRLFYRSRLQKRLTILRSLLIVATRYVYIYIYTLCFDGSMCTIYVHMYIICLYVYVYNICAHVYYMSICLCVQYMCTCILYV